jgi:hypothetical protein
MAKKLKRNDKCHCGSNKKYKQCCLYNDDIMKVEIREKTNELYENGHELSPELQDVCDFFKKEFPTFKVLDISNILTTSSYRPIQEKHYTADTIMLASRNEKNDQVFKTRGDAATNWMVLFRGAHQVFNQYSFENMKKQLLNMIECRLKDENYEY